MDITSWLNIGSPVGVWFHIEKKVSINEFMANGSRTTLKELCGRIVDVLGCINGVVETRQHETDCLPRDGIEYLGHKFVFTLDKDDDGTIFVTCHLEACVIERTGK